MYHYIKNTNGSHPTSLRSRWRARARVRVPPSWLARVWVRSQGRRCAALRTRRGAWPTRADPCRCVPRAGHQLRARRHRRRGAGNARLKHMLQQAARASRRQPLSARRGAVHAHHVGTSALRAGRASLLARDSSDARRTHGALVSARIHSHERRTAQATHSVHARARAPRRVRSALPPGRPPRASAPRPLHARLRRHRRPRQPRTSSRGPRKALCEAHCPLHRARRPRSWHCHYRLHRRCHRHPGPARRRHRASGALQCTPRGATGSRSSSRALGTRSRPRRAGWAGCWPALRACVCLRTRAYARASGRGQVQRQGQRGPARRPRRRRVSTSP